MRLEGVGCISNCEPRFTDIVIGMEDGFILRRGRLPVLQPPPRGKGVCPWPKEEKRDNSCNPLMDSATRQRIGHRQPKLQWI